MKSQSQKPHHSKGLEIEVANAGGSQKAEDKWKILAMEYKKIKDTNASEHS